jgi:hypothetical protein
VVSAREYRANADECMDWARTARSERERSIFVQMAQTWLHAAMLIEICEEKGVRREVVQSAEPREELLRTRLG